ncbi:protein rep (plasmid) [Clostridium botulinum]|nr:protein rep [Clostridium botulinum]
MSKCTKKKKKIIRLEGFIKPYISKSNLNLIKECGRFLELLADKGLENRKLYRGNFCKNRFCPMCSWRLARKNGVKINVLLNYLKEEHKKEFIFLTLTTPNVDGENLENEIKKYNKNFEKLIKRKEVKNITQGYIRKLEVTYNKESNTYHPHFHIIIAVNKSYFNSRNYISQPKWLNLWREVTNNYNITQVHIKKINISNSKAIGEIAKYSAKDNDYLTSKIVFEVFYNALKGKQLIVYSKSFKEAIKLYNKGLLDKYKHKDQIEYIYLVIHKWNIKKYEVYLKRKLTNEEMKEINKGLNT